MLSGFWRHYKFTYDSPVNGKPLVILLDILFERNPYANLIERQIQNEMLITEGENLTVRIPDVNSILGDKLTAFAPHTTGIRFGIYTIVEVKAAMAGADSDAVVGGDGGSAVSAGLQAKDFKDLANVDVIAKVGALFTVDMKKSGVLASVSLAQFILESGYGKSELAVNANNCFGMKKVLSGNT